jgi:hypothetical protein
VPKKPSSPFGHISFAKSGAVRSHITSLSSDKPEQELEAARRFVELHNAAYPLDQINSLEQLPENEHDFRAAKGNLPILIQLTELVDREYAAPMSQEEYDRAEWQVAVQKSYGEIPWRVDTQKRDMALSNLINKKASRYAPSSTALWLVVFTTDAGYLVEHQQNGGVVQSTALQNARSKLTDHAHQLFGEIWFTDLETRPILVWARASGP